jgi:PAS domain S-box-containing protein
LEEALGEAEQTYRTLFENAVEGIFRSTVDGHLELANPALAHILGYASPEELIYCIPDILSQIYADPARREEFLEQVSRRGAISDYEARVQCKDGTTIWCSIHARAAYDQAGELTGFEGFVQDITRRKVAEEALYESEERFRSFVQHVSDVITICETDGTVRYESPAIERVLGYRAEELIGQNVFDYVHPDDLERLTGAITEGLSGLGTPLTVEFRSRHADGTWRFLEAIVNSQANGSDVSGVVISMSDITERNKAEDALRQSEQLYRSVIEQVAENIFLVDAESRRLLQANKAFRRSLGYSSEELRSLTLYDFVAHDRESIERNIERVMGGHPFSGERMYRRKDGSLLHAEVNVSSLSYNGKDAMLAVAHDVTEHKRTEERFRRSLDMLLALREAGQILGTTLELEEIGSRLLEIMRGVSGLTAAVISREDERGRLRLWRASNLKGLWHQARYTPEAEAARQEVLKTGECRFFWLQGPNPEGKNLAGVCLPLRMRERTAGVLEAYGPESLAEEDTLAILSSLAAQSASALENARLYEELAEREERLGDLISKLFAAQEEERRRVAYEVHDGLAQLATTAHQYLQAFARLYPPGSEEVRNLLDQALGWIQQTVGEARRVIADLRPTALDDFGLQTALCLEAEASLEEGYDVSYEENLGDERLPLAIETALFRIAQEALNNVRKHANTERIRLSLVRSGERVRLSVRDWGRGFDGEAPASGGPGERVGLSSMYERVALLGGNLRIDSRPRVGTLITATIPLSEQKEAEPERAHFE